MGLSAEKIENIKLNSTISSGWYTGSLSPYGDARGKLDASQLFRQSGASQMRSGGQSTGMPALADQTKSGMLAIGNF